MSSQAEHNRRNAEMVREAAEAKRAAGISHIGSHIETRRDAEKLRRLIPADTRDLTARFCGDPLPGRSALDQRSASTCRAAAGGEGG